LPPITILSLPFEPWIIPLAFFIFWDRISLCNPDGSQICSSPASTQVIVLQVCTTMLSIFFFFGITGVWTQDLMVAR
jgi:hypothetical protein